MNEYVFLHRNRNFLVVNNVNIIKLHFYGGAVVRRSSLTFCICHWVIFNELFTFGSSLKSYAVLLPLVYFQRFVCVICISCKCFFVLGVRFVCVFVTSMNARTHTLKTACTLRQSVQKHTCTSAERIYKCKLVERGAFALLHRAAYKNIDTLCNALSLR